MGYNVRLSLKKQLQKKNLKARRKDKSWKDGSAVKSTGCSSRGPGLCDFGPRVSNGQACGARPCMQVKHHTHGNKHINNPEPYPHGIKCGLLNTRASVVNYLN